VQGKRRCGTIQVAGPSNASPEGEGNSLTHSINSRRPLSPPRRPLHSAICQGWRESGPPGSPLPLAPPQARLPTSRDESKYWKPSLHSRAW